MFEFFVCFLFKLRERQRDREREREMNLRIKLRMSVVKPDNSFFREKSEGGDETDK